MAAVINIVLIFNSILFVTNGYVLDPLARDEYIIGGDKSSPGEAPYQVSLRNSDMEHVCGGSIIDTNWVLTAAHCIHNVHPVFVVVGTNQLNNGGTIYDISLSIKHLWYDPSKFENDIALIKTKSSIEYTDLVQPISLPWKSVEEGEILTLSGWGLTNISGVIPNDLQIANVKTISNEECQSRLSGYTVLSSNLCTFTGLGACFGDSGGPLVSNGYIHSLVSWGVPNCSKTYPEVGVRVFNYNVWIYAIRFLNFWR